MSGMENSIEDMDIGYFIETFKNVVGKAMIPLYTSYILLPFEAFMCGI